MPPPMFHFHTTMFQKIENKARKSWKKKLMPDKVDYRFINYSQMDRHQIHP